ncbi:uncharacterized protein LOC117075400 isoform X1 [Trachypithecus francoisi]|uniref:uncharacterized protein LOC117075400 isoform X1 n=1 Tax=Trachypithecus francoisi TaxID=54180 RepID=UPI00141AEBBD|nr:uncharacterized protein LOC117075400 isoform X1 [Trachypithecus francoisi]
MALSQVPGLRVSELLSVKDEDDLAHTAEGWRNVTQRRGFRLRSARGPRGPGEPCVFAWWEWFTGKVDGRYPANRHALYCLGVNSLESKYQQPLWNVFPLVQGLKISHKKHHSALAEVLAGYSIIPLLCPKKAPEIFPCDPVTLHLYRLSKHLMTVEEEVGDRTWIWKAHSMDLISPKKDACRKR